MYHQNMQERIFNSNFRRRKIYLSGFVHERYLLRNIHNFPAANGFEIKYSKIACKRDNKVNNATKFINTYH